MNYETFLLNLADLEKGLKDHSQASVKSTKNLSKALSTGDLKTAGKELDNLKRAIDNLTIVQASMVESVGQFDANEYLASGLFTADLFACAAEKEINIAGDFPLYEIFPNKLKVDIDTCEVILDKKRFTCLRPATLINIIAGVQEKLHKVPFNATAFIGELVDAYDTLIAKKQQKGKRIELDSDVLLKDVYTTMIPMARFRKEYDMQAFAFDLARLIEADPETKDGRKVSFATKRDNNGLRIVDSNGKERWLELVKFYAK